MKFLFDENVHNGLLPFLKALGHEVAVAPKSTKNGELFGTALKEERILVTRDSDFLAEKFASSKHFGIVLLRVPAKDLGAQKTAFSNLLAGHPSTKDFSCKVVRINPDGNFEFLSL